MVVASGTFAYNRDQIVRRALRQVGAISNSETPNAAMMQDAVDALNAMIAQWQATGIHLWKETEGVLFPVPGQIEYQIGVGTGDRAVYGEQVMITSAVTSASAGTQVLQVASPGISPGDVVGVVDPGNGIFWTFAEGISDFSSLFSTDFGPPITIGLSLPWPVLAGATVVSYPVSAILPRPLRVLNARRLDLVSGIEIPLIRMSRLDYREMPNKLNSGTMNEFFYDPQLGLGRMWVWQNPFSSRFAMRFTSMQPFGSFANASDTGDFPVECTNAVVWNLASEIALEYDCPQGRYEMITTKASQALDLVTGFDREPESYVMAVDFMGWG